MSSTHRSKFSSDPVPHKYSIKAAFERSQEGKACPACNKIISRGVHRSHVNNCKVKIDEDECMITRVVTREEKIGLPIVLDGDEEIKKEKEDTDSDHIPSKDTDSSPIIKKRKRSTSARKRSSKITRQCQSNSVDENSVVETRRSTRFTKRQELVIQQRKATEDALLQESGTYEVEEQDIFASQLGFDFSAGVHDSEKNKQPNETEDKEQNMERKVFKNATLSNSFDELVKQNLGSPQDSKTTATMLPVISPIIEIENENPLQISLINRSDDQPVYYEKYTVKFFSKMIDEVIYRDGSPYGTDYWNNDIRYVETFKKLNKTEQELFIRLFTRKRQWFPESQLTERYINYPDLSNILTRLETMGFIENGSKCLTVDDIINLATAKTLQKIAKIYQIVTVNKSKEEIANSLKKFSLSQQDIFGRSKGIETKMIHNFLKEMGRCFRVSVNVDTCFKSIFSLYSPTGTSSKLIYDDPGKNIESQLLYTLLKVETGQLQFPGPKKISKLLNIYKNYDVLKEYVRAKELEITVVEAIYIQHFDRAIKCEELATNLLHSYDIDSALSLPPSLRRFTAPTVLVRILGQIANAYEKTRMYQEAVLLQRFILHNKLTREFCCSSRGFIWERLAINLESHLKLRDDALDELILALKDPHVKPRDQLTLQLRALKLSKGKFPEVVDCKPPNEKKIFGMTLGKNLGDIQQNTFIIRGTDGTVNKCSVEEIARRHYLEKENMTHGIHAEGQIWHTIFGILFYEIIYDHSIDNVWFCETQTHPIDLNFPEFYERRKVDLERRLQWLSNLKNDELYQIIQDCWTNYNLTTKEISWNLFKDADECYQFVITCPRKGLLGVFKRMFEDYRNTRSGFPDLTVWNINSSVVAVIEVKGPGDRLSSKQKLWLHHFSTLGFRSEVCYVLSQRDRSIQ